MRESKEELASIQKEYDEKIAEQQEKVKSLIEDLKIKIEQEKENAEEMMNRLHSDIKRWSEDEKTQKRLKASKAIATSIVELKEMLENETDDEAKKALEQQIEMLKGTLKNGAYTKSEKDTDLEALKSLAKSQNIYYEDYSKSLDKLDELEQIQIQLEDMGIETESKDFSQKNTEAWKRFVNQYNNYINEINLVCTDSEKSNFSQKIEYKVKQLWEEYSNNKKEVDYSDRIESLSSEFDAYYKNFNVVKKQELKERLENEVGRLSATPDLADELRNEFEVRIDLLNTDELLMLKDLKSISDDMDKKIKEIEGKQTLTYPQEIIDAFEKFDKLCDEVKEEMEDPSCDDERAVYEHDFETQRVEWKAAIENKEEIDVAKIQEKYEDLNKRLTVYKENWEKIIEVLKAIKEKSKQATTEELKGKAKEDLLNVTEVRRVNLELITEKFDGTPIDVSELLKIIEGYIIPEEIDLDQQEPFSDEEAKQEEVEQEEAEQEEVEQEEAEQEEAEQEETEQEEAEQEEAEQDETEQDKIETPEAEQTIPNIDELLEMLGVPINESADSRLLQEEAEVIFGGKYNDEEAIKRAQDARERENKARKRKDEEEKAAIAAISDDLGKINKFVSDNYEKATIEKWQGSEYYATIYDECKQKLQGIEDIKWFVERNSTMDEETKNVFNQAIEEVRDKINDLYEKIQDKYKIAEKVKDIKFEIDGLIEEGKSIKRVKKEIKKRIKECEISDKAEEEINEYLTNKTPLTKKREGLLSRAVGGVKDFFFPELEEDDDEHEIEETEEDVDITKVESLKTILAKKNDNTARIKAIAERSDLNIKEIKTILEFFNIAEDEYNEYSQLDKHGRFGFGIRFGGSDTEKAQSEANKKEQDKTKSKSGITK